MKLVEPDKIKLSWKESDCTELNRIEWNRKYQRTSLAHLAKSAAIRMSDVRETDVSEKDFMHACADK